MEIGLAQLLQILSILASIIVAVILAINTRATKSEEKKETASTQLILSKIELSETRMMGKMEVVAEGQVDIKKKQDHFDRKLGDLDEQLRQRKEESSLKQKRIDDLERENKENKEKLATLQKMFEDFKHNVQMNELKGLAIPNEKFSKP
jgi:chromosome segregation ATPase